MTSNNLALADMAPADSALNDMHTTESMLTIPEATKALVTASDFHANELTATRLSAVVFSATTFKAKTMTAAKLEITHAGITATDLTATGVVATDVVASGVTMTDTPIVHHIAGNNPTKKSKKSLANLPSELIDMVSTDLEQEDIIALRTTCRDLRLKTGDAFCRIWFADPDLGIEGSAEGIQFITAMLQSSHFLTAQSKAKALTIHAPVPHNRYSILDDEAESEFLITNHVPTVEDVTSLLIAMPQLETLSLRGPPCEGGLDFTPVFLKGIARLRPQSTLLSNLWIQCGRVNGALLMEVLETHRHTLRDVMFKNMELLGSSSWKDILTTLTSMDLEVFQMYGAEDRRLQSPGAIEQTQVFYFPPSTHSDCASDNPGGMHYVTHDHVWLTKSWVKRGLAGILQALEETVTAA